VDLYHATKHEVGGPAMQKMIVERCVEFVTALAEPDDPWDCKRVRVWFANHESHVGHRPSLAQTGDRANRGAGAALGPASGSNLSPGQADVEGGEFWDREFFDWW
jgi:hypothetical protein